MDLFEAIRQSGNAAAIREAREIQNDISLSTREVERRLSRAAKRHGVTGYVETSNFDQEFVESFRSSGEQSREAHLADLREAQVKAFLVMGLTEQEARVAAGDPDAIRKVSKSNDSRIDFLLSTTRSGK